MSQPHPCDGCQHDATCVDGRHCLPYKTWTVSRLSELTEEVHALIPDGSKEASARCIAIGEECLKINACLSGRRKEVAP